MAARSIWSGSISFGLVNCPVKLFSATSPKKVSFNQLNEETGNRIKMPKLDSITDEVPSKIVKGFEVKKGRYVVITDEELEQVAPAKTKMLAIEQFVDVADIDPMAYDSHYYFGPGDETGGTVKAYRLLAQAMSEHGKVGIGRLVIRSRESLAALRVTDDGVLMVSTLLFADELLAACKQFEIPDGAVEPSDMEVQMAGQLIAAFSKPFDHAAFRDEYRDQVLELIEKKAAGETIEAPAGEVEAAPSPDLMAALKASLEAAGGVDAGAAAVEAAVKPKRASRKKETSNA